MSVVKSEETWDGTSAKSLSFHACSGPSVCPLPQLPVPASAGRTLAATGAQAARAGLSSFRPRALQLPSLVGCFLLAEEEHLGIGKSFLGNNYSQAKEPKKVPEMFPSKPFKRMTRSWAACPGTTHVN